MAVRHTLDEDENEGGGFDGSDDASAILVNVSFVVVVAS